MTITANEALAAEAAGTESRTAKSGGHGVSTGRIGRRADASGRREAHGARAWLNDKAIRSAREALGVKIERDGFGPGSKSLWSLQEGS